GVPAVAAGDTPILAVGAYRLFIGKPATNPAPAAVLGSLLIALTALILLIQRRYIAGRSFATGARRVPPPIKLTAPWHILATLYCWGVVLLALVPFFAILTLSFLEFRGPVLHRAFSLGNYAEVFSTACGPPAPPPILAPLFCWGVVLLALAPFLATLPLSFLEFRGPVLHRAFSLGNYAELFSTAGGPLANTLILASLAAGLAGLIGVPVGWVLARTRS